MIRFTCFEIGKIFYKNIVRKYEYDKELKTFVHVDAKLVSSLTAYSTKKLGCFT